MNIIQAAIAGGYLSPGHNYKVTFTNGDSKYGEIEPLSNNIRYFWIRSSYEAMLADSNHVRSIEEAGNFDAVVTV